MHLVDCLYYIYINDDLVGKVEKRARKPLITQEMISKTDERKKWKNVNTEEGGKNYRRLTNELKRATDNAKNEYLENICNEIMEFQRTGHYDLMYKGCSERNAPHFFSHSRIKTAM